MTIFEGFSRFLEKKMTFAVHYSERVFSHGGDFLVHKNRRFWSFLYFLVHKNRRFWLKLRVFITVLDKSLRYFPYLYINITNGHFSKSIYGIGLL